MNSIPQVIQDNNAQMVAIRRDLHAHPEIGFEEVRTAGTVAEHMRSYGIEVHEGIGGTGVVGVLKGKEPGNRSIGLRADMDALPMTEADANLVYRSKNPGLMHACGHDGHVAMLLSAARYLAQTRNFAGKAVFIFQPAEEGLGGGPAMLKDGLFERFPVDQIFALHNAPDRPTGTFAFRKGAALGTTDRFEITVKGVGGHASMPHLAVDPVFIASQVVLALQGLVSRNTDPLDSCVLSIGQIKGGDAFNVIPSEVYIEGTTRTFDHAIRDRLERSIAEVSHGIATAQGGSASVSYHRIMTVLVNEDEATDFAARVAQDLVGVHNVVEHRPMMASEDFAYMLEKRPGAYLLIGQAEDGHSKAMVHNPAYDFNDNILPLGAAYFAKLVETALPT